MVKENIFTFPVSTGSYQQFIDEIFKLSEHKASSYVCFANVHMVIEAYNNPSFSTAISNADIVTPDGKPVALFLKFLKKINQERVAGFLAANPQFAPAPLAVDRLCNCAQAFDREATMVTLTPLSAGTDGFFIQALTRIAA